MTKIIWDKLEHLKSGYISTQNRIKTKAVQNSKTGYVSTQKKINIKTVKKRKSGYISNIYKAGNITTLQTETTIKKDEVKKTFSSYQEQKKTITEYNRLTVQNYNVKYNQ